MLEPTMHKLADSTSGQAKTDPLDAFIVTDTAHTMPPLRRVDRNDEVLSALKILSGLDDDIARDCTHTINRLRGILVQIYPSLKRVFTDEVLQRTFVRNLLIHYDGPTKLQNSGKTRGLACARNHAKKDPEALVDDIVQALGAQTVTVPGTNAANILLAISDCPGLPDAAHPTAYAKIPPVTRRLGTSIRSESPARSGNKRHKNAIFRTA